MSIIIPTGPSTLSPPFLVASARGASQPSISYPCRKETFKRFLRSSAPTRASPCLFTPASSHARSHRHYVRANSLLRNLHPSCILHAGPATSHSHLHSSPSFPPSNKAFVVSCHPEDWAISVTELAKQIKETQPINEVLLSKVVAAVSDLKNGRCIEMAPSTITFSPTETPVAVWIKNLAFLWRLCPAPNTA